MNGCVKILLHNGLLRHCAYVLLLCLSSNNSVFNNTNYIQTDGTARGAHMLWLYSNIVMAGHECKTLSV